jgi:hypothetical protein
MNRKLLRILGALIALSLMLAACGTTVTETVSPISTPAAHSSAGEQIDESAQAKEITALVQQDLTERLGVTQDNVTVLAVKAVEWPDASLGCPKPDTAYATVVTPGYQITLAANDKEYTYHTGEDTFVLCEGSGEVSEKTMDEQQASDREGDPQATTLVDQSKQDLSERLKVAVTDIRLQSVQAVEWSDSSLGCPEPGMNYLMVISPGYLIKLEAGGKTYEYHADLEHAFYCKDPKPPARKESQEDIEAELSKAAQMDLAKKLGVTSTEIEVVKIESVMWPDGSLGCPKPGMMYTQAVVPGYRITLSSGGQEYDYHADQKTVFLCEQ